MLRPLKDVEMYLQHNKVTNLRLAIASIDGVVIRPGETFSIWRLVGRPTARRGFLEGLVLHNGRIEKGIGGGLCQLGNLLYWMALHSPLTVVERYRHGFDVFPDINRTIPFACGATLAYNYIDLQLRNDTEHTFQLNLWLDDEYLNGKILSSRPSEFEYHIFETDHFIKMQPWGGYTRHNRIWQRRTSLIDGLVNENLVTENHAIMMYNPLLTD
jgi:vancomycin resistance protein VanW